MLSRGASLLRAIAALVLTAALVVGVPFLLVVLVGNPFPAELPTIDEVRILLTQNGQGFTNFIISTLAIIIWFIWAQLVLALLVEVVATARNAETRRLPTAPGIQALAARLVAAMTLATVLAAGPVLAPAVGALNLDSIAPVASSAQVDIGPSNLNTTPRHAASPLAQASPFASSAQAGTPTPGISALRSAMPGIAAPALTLGSSTQDASAESRAAEEALATVSEETSSLSIIVNEQTELWDLADAAYGDGVSWKLIAQANAGLSDASGAVMTSETETVAPGTTLVLPAGPEQGVPERSAIALFGVITESDQPGSVDAVHTVESGDSMWTLAEGEVERRLDRDASDAEVADYWVDVVEANQDVASGDVDLIYPGERIVMPRAMEPGQPTLDSAPAPEAAVEEAETETDPALPATAAAITGIADGPSPANDTVSTTADNSTADKTAADNSTADKTAPDRELQAPATPKFDTSVSTDQDARSVSLQAVGLMTFGAAIFSAGIVSALRRRRDLQRRTRPAGTIARQPSSEAAAFEAALTHASHELIESQQGVGWQMMPAETIAAMRAAGPVQIHAEESGQLAAVAVADTSDHDQAPVWEPRRIDLATAGSPVEPSQLQAELDALLEASTVGQGAEPKVPEPGSAIAPTSLVLGTDSSSGEAVFLDLESASVLGLHGDDEAVHRFARSAVLDLAVSDRADDLCVIAVQVGHEVMDLERVRPVDSFESALEQAIRCGHALPDSTTPVVVVSATAPVIRDGIVEPSVADLLDLGAVVVSPGIESAVWIDLNEGRGVIFPAGTWVELAALNSDDYRAVSELVDTSSSAAIAVVDSAISVEEMIDVIATEACPVEAGPVEVKVLGPVEVVGADAFSSLKAVDVVTYLAFHRHGVDADQLKTWVWPPFDPPTDKAFANVLSRARTGLGTDEEGTPFLSRAGSDKTYRLAEEVTTDFDRFRAIVELADTAPNTQEQIDLLKQALELIRGVPFTGGAASSFAWADNHVRAQVEYTIDETVHRCADLALNNDDLATARWAALKGLELVPGCEQCFRRRFLVAGAGNNRTELRRAMADLEASATVDLGEPEAIDTISGELLDLYHELDQALIAGSGVAGG